MSNASGGVINIGNVTSSNGATTNRGIYMSGSGDILIKGNGSSTNYLLFNSTGLAIKTPNFSVDTSGNVTMSGNITASSGLIAGWTINSTNFTKDAMTLATTYIKAGGLTDTTTNTAGRGFYVSSSGDVLIKGSTTANAHFIKFDSNGLAISASNFSVSTNGSITASNALLTGTITSSAGKIGCWNLSSTSIYSGSNTHNNTSSIYFGTLGLSIKDKFVVTSAGVLTATGVNMSGTLTSSAGLIGGWSLTETSIYSGSSTFNTASGMYFGQLGLSIRDQFRVTS